MTDPIKERERRRTTAIIILAAVVVMATLVYVSIYRGAPATTAPAFPSKRFEGSSFVVLTGEGSLSPRGAELRREGSNGQGVIAALVSEIPADVYRQVRFSAPGIDLASGAAVYWHRQSDPSVSHFKALTLDQVRAGEVTLGPQDNWSGPIQTFGFVVQGPLGSPVTIEHVEFSAATAAE